MQISLDGATAEVNDRVRGPGSYATAIRAMEHLADAGFRGFKLSVVVTRENAGQLDAFKAIADRYGAQLRLTRLRPSGRGADVWDELHPTAAQQRELYDWLLAHGEEVLTGDSFFHLSAYGEALPGPEPLRRRPRRVPDRPGRRRLRVPVRDPRRVPGRQRARARRLRAGVARVGAVPRAAPAADGRRVRVLSVLRLVPRRLHGGEVLHRPAARRPRSRVRARPRRAAARRARGDAPAPKPSVDHSRRKPPERACDENPLPTSGGPMASTRRVVRVGRRGAAAREAARCPKSVYAALIAGAERGVTLDDNVERVQRARLPAAHRHRASGTGSGRELATTVLGQEISLPVLISPTGVQAVHPDGEIAVARAAAAAGTAMGLSSFASKPIEEVVAAEPADLLPDLLAGHARADRRRSSTAPARRARRG